MYLIYFMQSITLFLLLPLSSINSLWSDCTLTTITLTTMIAVYNKNGSIVFVVK